MRSSVPTIPSRLLSRVAAAALLSGLAAGCSSDTSRFSLDPFSNPFSSQSNQTASIPTEQAYPARSVHAQPLPPAGVATYSRPIAAQPLPPVGSVGTVPAARSPEPAYDLSQAAPRANGTTGSVSPAAARTSKGWSGQGGILVTARDGDTVDSLSNRYGVPASAIMATNGLNNRDLYSGQQITIPVYSVKQASAQAASPAPVVGHRQVEEPAPRRQAATGDVHVVKPGETLTSIARDLGTTRLKLAKANGIDEWTSVRIGQKIKVGDAPAAQASLQPKSLGQLPAKAVSQTATKTIRTVEIKTPKTATPSSKPVALAVVEKPKSDKANVEKVTLEKAKVEKAKVAAKPVDDEKEETASVPASPAGKAAATTKVATSAPAEGAPQFRWPVKGRVIQAFGQSSDGINISVPEGTEVKAAENGVVAYAGNELKGYGNLVLIRHADGYVTAYAHAKDINVKRGDPVKRGQTIATAGQTGNVTSPQLLFELRKGATPVDPRQYLSGT